MFAIKDPAPADITEIPYTFPKTDPGNISNKMTTWAPKKNVLVIGNKMHINQRHIADPKNEFKLVRF